MQNQKNNPNSNQITDITESKVLAAVSGGGGYKGPIPEVIQLIIPVPDGDYLEHDSLSK